MGLAYVAYKLFSLEGKGAQKIIYLGDSENDNPACVKADVSIGIWSDDRLNPNLLCTDSLKSDELSTFHKRLKDNKFVPLDNTFHQNQRYQLLWSSEFTLGRVGMDLAKFFHEFVSNRFNNAKPRPDMLVSLILSSNCFV